MQNLRFENANRVYDLPFNHVRYMQLVGNSATGKSLFVQDFLDQRDNVNYLSNSLVINYQTKEQLKLIDVPCEYDYVIIDNADILLTDDIANKIFTNLINCSDTYWIIIGRHFFSCTISLGSVGEIVNKKQGDKFYFTVDYTRVV